MLLHVILDATQTIVALQTPRAVLHTAYARGKSRSTPQCVASIRGWYRFFVHRSDSRTHVAAFARRSCAQNPSANQRQTMLLVSQCANKWPKSTLAENFPFWVSACAVENCTISCSRKTVFHPVKLRSSLINFRRQDIRERILIGGHAWGMFLQLNKTPEQNSIPAWRSKRDRKSFIHSWLCA